MKSDRALAILREHVEPALVERLLHLDRARTERPADVRLPPPDAEARVDADVVFAGGGLSLLVAAEVARLGASVLVLERARAGEAHREWNASARELRVLVDAGIVDDAGLDDLVVARYDDGICAFHGGTPRHVRGVLDHAVDGGPLLRRVRDVATARGVRFVDGASVVAVGAGEHGVRVGFTGGELTCRVLVDARGASSPWATADLVCPTVGGVIADLREGEGPREVDPRVGEILVTTEHATEGRQLVWEGFPGREGTLTVYLFAYELASNVPPGALVSLYGRFFETLASYKEGPARLVRPTFGYIPGWSRLGPAPQAPSPRIILVGDAAARHSPLTFCGFGAMLRTFRPTAAAIVARARSERARPIPPEPIHAWTGPLARLMATRALEGPQTNELLDSAFGALEELGNDAFAALLRDEMDGLSFTRFLQRTARRHPAVYRETMRALGPRFLARWGVSVVRGALA